MKFSKRFFKKKLKIFNLNLFLNFFLITLEYKNPKILIKYIKHIFKKIHIREQFLLIYFIHNFIKTKLVRLIFNRFKVKGFYLKVKGKISAGGNARKKIYYIKK